MKVIGLTGGIGSGKSTISRFLAELGAVIIDSDKVGHKAFEPGTSIWQEIVATFGTGILAPDSSIDREKLGRIVFADPESRIRLNQIMHPRMWDMVKSQIEEYRLQGIEVVVLEAPLLVEAGWTSFVDEVWVIVASEATVIKRLKQRTGLSEAESLARIRSQLSSEDRVKHAVVIINNDGNLDELKTKVKELWQKLHKSRTDRNQHLTVL